MFPWEHLALGYICWSVFARLAYNEPSGDWAALVAVFGSQFPDLLDKPLSWWLELFPSGYSIGHSIFLVPVFVGAVYVLARWRGRRRLAFAFGIPHLSHLVSDVFYPIVLMRGPALRRIIWPLGTREASRTHLNAIELGLIYVRQTFAGVASGEFLFLVVFEFVLLGVAFLLWWWDGFPGLFLGKWFGRP